MTSTFRSFRLTVLFIFGRLLYLVHSKYFLSMFYKLPWAYLLPFSIKYSETLAETVIFFCESTFI